jgi:hypothetical protein
LTVHVGEHPLADDFLGEVAYGWCFIIIAIASGEHCCQRAAKDGCKRYENLFHN